MAQMNVDDLVKLLDSFSQKGGAAIKPQFEGDKAQFVVGNGETISRGIKESVKELADCLVEEEQRNSDIFVEEDPANCASCANIPNMNHIDIE
jgi:hypothetical protein